MFLQNFLYLLTISGNFKSSLWKISLKSKSHCLQCRFHTICFAKTTVEYMPQNPLKLIHSSDLLHQVNASIHRWQGHIQYDQYQHWNVSQNWAIKTLTVKPKIYENVIHHLFMVNTLCWLMNILIACIFQACANHSLEH